MLITPCWCSKAGRINLWLQKSEQWLLPMDSDEWLEWDRKELACWWNCSVSWLECWLHGGRHLRTHWIVCLRSVHVCHCMSSLYIHKYFVYINIYKRMCTEPPLCVKHYSKHCGRGDSNNNEMSSRIKIGCYLLKRGLEV